MKEDLKFICEDFKVKGKQAVEKRKEISQLEPNSAEYRVQTKVFENIIKELNKYGELIYSAILSFNNAPETFTSISKNDVLYFQLIQDEVTAMLKEHGIYMNYVHPNDKK